MHVSAADDSSSLLPITARQAQTFPGTEQKETIEVSTVTLDERFPDGVEEPALLKIDVQGYELEVLRGAERLLQTIGTVLVECSFQEFYAGQAGADEVIRFLQQRGFRLAGGTAPTVDRHGVLLQVDLIFNREVGG